MCQLLNALDRFIEILCSRDCMGSLSSVRYMYQLNIAGYSCGNLQGWLAVPELPVFMIL